MNKSSCRVCKSPVTKIFSGTLLENYCVDYFQCPFCGYVQTPEPFWLEEAYSRPINDVDTGLMMRSFWHKNITWT